MFPHTHPPVPEQDALRQRFTTTRPRGRVIGPKTAHELAAWFAQAIGPGFQIFLVTGIVTPALYRELARLYDLRHLEVEHWLDNLSRYVLRQPTIHPSDGRARGRRRGPQR